MSAETLCPMTKDGQHQKHPWQDVKTCRSGLACRACHKTWVWMGDTMEPTHQQGDRATARRACAS